MFPTGQTSTSVGDLAFKMLESDMKVANSQYVCMECGKASASKWDKRFGHKLDAVFGTPDSIVKWIGELENRTRKKCSDCSCNMVKQVSYREIPRLLVFEYPELDITTDHQIELKNDSGESHILYLRGIVYHGHDHFVSRIITPEGNMWFHDGISTGKHCINDGHLNVTSSEDLRHYQEKKLVLAVYAER
jgi:hypothetical protein